MRNLAVAAGALIIAAAAHVSIMASGGYFSPAAPLQLSIALGLVVGAICVGIAWRERRLVMVSWLVIALAAGEAFAVIMTAERTVVARDLAAAPIHEIEAARLKAEAREKAAEGKKSDADAAALTEAAKPGCRKECRMLIEGAKADAQREIEAARAELVALPPARSASPLADRLGIAGWALDLITAALASVAANGLGAALVAFGAHGAGKPDAHTESTTQGATTVRGLVAQKPKALPAPTARDHAAKFGRDMLVPSEGSVPVANLYGAYVDWCKVRDLAPLPARMVGKAMDDLFWKAGVGVEMIDGRPYLIGAQLLDSHNGSTEVVTPVATPS